MKSVLLTLNGQAPYQRAAEYARLCGWAGDHGYIERGNNVIEWYQIR